MSWLDGALQQRNQGESAAVTEFLQTGRISPSRLGRIDRRAWNATQGLSVLAAAGASARRRCGFLAQASTRAGALRSLEREIAALSETALKRAFPRVYEAQLRSRTLGGYNYPAQFTRLWELHLLRERFRSRRCVELGLGPSTAMLAEECAEVHSHEESKVWLARATYLEPWKNRSVVCATRKDGMRDDQPVVWYNVDGYGRGFDLVYVDGPSNRVPDADTATRERALAFDPEARLANADVERLWDAGELPQLVIIEGRSSTVGRLARVGASRYDLRLSSHYRSRAEGRLAPYFLFHSVLVRRDAR